jgi:hypothetical protein
VRKAPSTIREPTPEYNVEDLRAELEGYVRREGVSRAFNFGVYKSVSLGQAARGTGILALVGMLTTFLTVSKYVIFKLNDIKSALAHCCDEVEGLKPASMGKSRWCSDTAERCMTIMAHLRRIAGSELRFRQCASKLDDEKKAQLRQLCDQVECRSIGTPPAGNLGDAPDVDSDQDDKDGGGDHDDKADCGGSQKVPEMFTYAETVFYSRDGPLDVGQLSDADSLDDDLQTVQPAPARKTPAPSAATPTRAPATPTTKSQRPSPSKAGSPYKAATVKKPSPSKAGSPYSAATVKSPSPSKAGSPYSAAKVKSPSPSKAGSPYRAATVKSPSASTAGSPYRSPSPKTTPSAAPNVQGSKRAGPNSTQAASTPVKMVKTLAKDKSYIEFHPGGGKKTLLIQVSDKQSDQHGALITAMHEELQRHISADTTKEDAKEIARNLREVLIAP